MDSLLLFLHIIAWPFGILSTIWGILLIYWGYNYPGSTEELLDNMNGFKKTFNPIRPIIVAFICWAFIIAF